MDYDGNDDDTDPQVAEGIIECRWVHLSDLPDYRELLRARINYVVDFVIDEKTIIKRIKSRALIVNFPSPGSLQALARIPLTGIAIAGLP